MKPRFIVPAIVWLWIFTPHSLSAQTEKGTHLFGGGINLQTNVFSYGGINLIINPMYGYFPVNNFGILAVVNMSLTVPAYDAMLKYGIGPELRYYVGPEKVKVFFFGNAIPTGQRSGGYNYDRFNLSATGGFGMAVFPYRSFSVHIDVNFGYDRTFPAKYGNFIVGLKTTLYGLFSRKKKEQEIIPR